MFRHVLARVMGLAAIALTLSACGGKPPVSATVHSAAGAAPKSDVDVYRFTDAEIEVIRELARPFATADTHITVKRFKDTNLIEISAVGPNRAACAKICNAIADKYAAIADDGAARQVIKRATAD